jgi:membrane protein YdbS with pleckstrin-like domain
MFVTIIGIRAVVSFRLGLGENAFYEIVLVSVLLTIPLYFHQTTHYRVTRHAVFRAKGFLGKEEQSFPLSAIESVSQQQGPLERLFNCGNVVIKLKDGRKERLSGIKDPDVVGRKIRALL